MHKMMPEPWHVVLQSAFQLKTKFGITGSLEVCVICHTSNQGGARGIGADAKIAPSRLHVSDSKNFLSLRARKIGSVEWDMKRVCPYHSQHVVP